MVDPEVGILDGRWVLTHRQVDKVKEWAYLPDNPFSLGFEGEEWREEINSLLIPIPGTDRCVLIRKHGDDETYSMVTQDNWTAHGNLLMLVAVLHEYIANYHWR